MARRVASSTITVAALRTVMSLDKGTFLSELRAASASLKTFDQQAQGLASQISKSFSGAASGVGKGLQDATQRTTQAIARQVEGVERQLAQLTKNPARIPLSLDEAKFRGELQAARQQLAVLLATPAHVNVTANVEAARAKIASLQTQLATLKNQQGLGLIRPQVETGPAISSIGVLKQHVGSLVDSARNAASGMKNAFVGAFDGVRSQLTSLVQHAQNTGLALSVAITAPLVLAAKSALGIGMDYQQTFNLLQATLTATDSQMATLGKRAIELGADLTLPATSAADAMRAMLELGKAGLSVDQIMGAVKGTLQLSAAGELGNAQAAQIAANALNMWGLSGDQAIKVADLLAAAANASTAEVKDMGDAFQQGGSMAAQMRMPIEQFTTMLGIMANEGIKGSDAGTSLKTTFQRLAAPTDEVKGILRDLGINIWDVNGRLRDGRDIVNQFTTASSKLTDQKRNELAVTIFGADASRAAQIVLMGGVDAYDKMYTAVTRTGAAQDLAAARTKGLAGALEGLKSQVETFVLTESQRFLGTLEGWVRGVSDFIPKLSQLPQSFKDIAIGVGIALAAAGPLLLLFSGLATVIGMALSPIGILVAAFVGLGAAIATNMGGIRDQIIPIFQGVVSVITGSVLPAISSMAQWFQGFLPQAIGVVVNVFQQLYGWIAVNLPPAIQALGGLWQTVLAPALLWIAGLITGFVLPAVLGIATFIRENLVPILSGMAAVLLIIGVPAFVAWASAAIAAGAATLLAFAPFIPLFAAVALAVALLKAAWEDNFLGMRDILTAVGNAIGTALGWIGDRIKDFLGWLGIQLPQSGRESGSGFINNLNASVFAGLPTMNLNITGIGANFKALTQPAAQFGAAIGSQWIGNLCERIAQGMGVLNGQIQAIKTALATMSTLSAGGSVEGYGFGPSVALDPVTHMPIGGDNQVMSAADTQAYYAQKMSEYLTKQKGIAEAQIQDLIRASQGIMPDGTNINAPLNLFEGINGNGGGPNGTGGGNGGNGSGAGGGSGTKISALEAATNMAKQWAEGTRAAVQAIKDTMQIEIPAGINEKLDQLAQVLDLAVSKMQAVALRFGAEGLNAVSNFAEAANKVFGAFNTAYSLFERIADTGDKVLFGATKIAASTDALSEKVVIIMNNLGPRVKNWSEGASAQVGAFAEAAGKVFQAFDTAFSFFTRISETGDKVLFGATKIAATTDALSEKVVLIMNNLGPRVALWTEEADKIVGGFAETAGKVFESFSKALDFFDKLASTKVNIAGLADRVTELVNAARQVMDTLGPLTVAWNDVAFTGPVTLFATTVGGVVDNLLKAVGFFDGLGNSKTSFAPLADRVIELGNAARQIMDVIGPLTKGWNDKAFTDPVALFATTAGTVVDGLLKAVGFFGTLAESKVNFAGLADRVIELANASRQVLDTIGPLTKGWTDTDVTGGVTLFASTVGVVVENLGKAATLFTQLSAKDFKLPTTGIVTSLFNALDGLLVEFDARQADWGARIIEQSGKLAGWIGQVIQGVAGAVQLLTALADEKLVMPGREAIAAFFVALDLVLTEFSRKASEWMSKATKVNADLAGFMQTILQGIGAAVQVLAGIADFKAVPSGAIPLFFAALDRFLDEFVAYSASWATQALDKIAPLATSIGLIADGIGKAVGPLLDVMAFKMPEGGMGNPIGATQTEGGGIAFGAPTSGMYGFFAALDAFLTEFVRLSATWKDKATGPIADISRNIGVVMEGLGKAIDTVLKVVETKDIDQGMIESALAKVGLVIEGVQALINSLPAGFVEGAGPLAAALSAIAGAIQAIFTALANDLSAQKESMVALWADAGIAALGGFEAGLSDSEALKKLEAAARAAMRAALDAAKNEGEIFSPSKKSHREVGKPWGLGIAGGIWSSLGDISRAAKGVMKAGTAGAMNFAGAGAGYGGTGNWSGAAAAPGMIIHGNPIIVGRDIVAQNAPPGVAEFFRKALPHKQSRNRGLDLGR